MSCDDDDDDDDDNTGGGGQHQSRRHEKQQQKQSQAYKIIPDPAMARFAPPSAAALGQFDSIQSAQQQIPASQQQQQPSITMQEDTSITTSYAPAASITPDGLASGTGADGSYNTDDNFLPLDFMSWLDSFDWAQESLLNYS